MRVSDSVGNAAISSFFKLHFLSDERLALNGTMISVLPFLTLVLPLASCQYNNWAQSRTAAESLISNLTLAEIINITFAYPVQGVFTKLSSLDGPNGVNTPVSYIDPFKSCVRIARPF